MRYQLISFSRNAAKEVLELFDQRVAGNGGALYGGLYVMLRSDETGTKWRADSTWNKVEWPYLGRR
ncbi:hypothetical protein BDV06DRAFT_184484 [Aspergillus oleicola]